MYRNSPFFFSSLSTSTDTTTQNHLLTIYQIGIVDQTGVSCQEELYNLHVSTSINYFFVDGKIEMDGLDISDIEILKCSAQPIGPCATRSCHIVPWYSEST